MRKKLRRFLYHNVLHADDTPHRLALGVAIGLFVAFTPTIGVQMIIALALASLLRANKAVCIPLVWITNPVTLWPIYGFCLAMGKRIMMSGDTPATAMDQLSEFQHVADTGFLAGLFQAETWLRWMHTLLQLSTELWIGGVVMGVVSGLAAYLVTHWSVRTYRERRRLRVLARSIRQARTRSARQRRTSHEAA